MTTLLFVFLAALFCALIITPLVRRIALHYGIVHKPSERCMHERATPRIGGVSLFFSFFLALFLCLPFKTDVSLLLYNSQVVVLFCSATLIFLMGLLDDIRPLPPYVKLLIQLLAAVIAWFGEIQINVVSISLSGGLELGWLSLPVTVLWIVFVTNAINLIDGLDGLAAGICLFASVIMLVLCITSGRILIALCFASLVGSLLGFLRYNFNPASIFMGDSGSYFVGYTFAVLSILGSIKGQATVAMLIPFISLGVPLFDTLLSPLRRFVRGKKMFSADRNHLHHRLMEGGKTQRQTVVFLYCATLVLGGTAFTLTLIKDERAGLILLVPALAIFFAFKKLGYLNYLAVDKIYGWLRDITETSHISHTSRSFLDHQIRLREAKDFNELWLTTQHALHFLGMDNAVLRLNRDFEGLESLASCYNWSNLTKQKATSQKDNKIEKQPDYYTFKIEFPLIDRVNRHRNEKSTTSKYIGSFTIYKDISSSPIHQFTLRRTELLKRDLVNKILDLYVTESRSAEN